MILESLFYDNLFVVHDVDSTSRLAVDAATLQIVNQVIAGRLTMDSADAGYSRRCHGGALLDRDIEQGCALNELAIRCSDEDAYVIQVLGCAKDTIQFAGVQLHGLSRRNGIVIRTRNSA